MSRIVDSRDTLVALLSAAVGFALFHRMAFPEHHPLLQLILLHRPQLFYGIKYAYLVSLFTTPFITFSVLFSLMYIFGARARKDTSLVQLPVYPEPTGRDRLYMVIGEVHNSKRPEPVESPRWLAIPERGLYTGIAIFGAIGSGKTSGCMFPFAEQVFGYRADDRDRRIGGLILEVKGDFCEKVRRILESSGRADDYVEISLDSPYRYNPLHNDLDAYALAYGIASLLNNLFGKGKEPFWQQAYTNLVKFIILLHKVLYDYVTLFDVYECAINPELLEQKIVQGDAAFGTQSVLIGIDDFLADRNLESYPFEKDPEQGRMKAPFSEKLRAYLAGLSIPHEVRLESSAAGNAAWTQDEEKRQQFEAVKRWFYQDWKRIDARLRTSIVEGISVFLSLFDDNPAVKRVFCPPKETYDPVANQDGKYGKPLPPFSDLIETGTVCALNFPISANPGLAKAIGTLLKQDFQRSVLNRIPRIERQTDRHWRRSVLPL